MKHKAIEEGKSQMALSNQNNNVLQSFVKLENVHNCAANLNS